MPPDHASTGITMAQLFELAYTAVTAAPASASLGLVCAAPVWQPFTPWGDPAWYSFAPNGGFENGATGWTLAGGAKVVAGSESFGAHGAGEKNALSLPSGSSATTPQVCVGVLDPTMRYFAANDGGLLSLMSVSILYYPPGGGVITLPLGVNVGAKAWAPSLPTLVTANLLGVLSGGKAMVAFRFTPIGLGAKWRIDDVYVDPMARH